MHGDGGDEEARGQIARRDQPPLSPADRRPDEDGVVSKPGGVQHEGAGLVDVGQEEVVEEDEELVRMCPFSCAWCIWCSSLGGVVADKVMLGEPQGQIDRGSRGLLGGPAGLSHCSEVPSHEFDSEVEQHGSRQNEGKGSQDGYRYQALAMDDGKRNEVVAFLVQDEAAIVVHHDCSNCSVLSGVCSSRTHCYRAAHPGGSRQKAGREWQDALPRYWQLLIKRLAMRR